MVFLKKKDTSRHADGSLTDGRHVIKLPGDDKHQVPLAEPTSVQGRRIDCRIFACATFQPRSLTLALSAFDPIILAPYRRSPDCPPIRFSCPLSQAKRAIPPSSDRLTLGDHGRAILQRRHSVQAPHRPSVPRCWPSPGSARRSLCRQWFRCKWHSSGPLVRPRALDPKADSPPFRRSLSDPPLAMPRRASRASVPS